jgi:hypothetical protein
MNTRRHRAFLISILALAAVPLCSIPNIFDMNHDATQTAQLATDYAYWATKFAGTETAAAATLRAQHPDTPEATSTQSVMALIISKTPRPKKVPTGTFTPTPSVPIVWVSVATNCRTGPSIDYPVVTSLLVGQTAEVVGKNTRTDYWIIRTPGGTGTCWLWGQYASVAGNTRTVPIMTPPRVPSPTKPPRPALPPPPTDTPYQ